MHPGLLEKAWYLPHQTRSEQGSDNGRWPRNAHPQAAAHQFELGHKDVTFCIIALIAFLDVNQEPNDVKQPCKPGDHKNDMKCFEDSVVHGKSFVPKVV